MGICSSPFCVITEFLVRGSLFNYLKQHHDIEPALKLRIIFGIAKGMFHIHLEDIVHRDLATRNVLLSSTLEPKISDFVSGVKR
jgi:serine/threonine protein kinase